jgi:hypothetical protein
MTQFDLKHKTEQQLREIIGSNNPGTDFHVAAVIELEKRLEDRNDKKQYKRDFWTRIIAVAGLLIALASLIWNIVKEILKH